MCMQSIDLSPGTKFRDTDLETTYTIESINEYTVVLSAPFKIHGTEYQHTTDLSKDEIRERVTSGSWEIVS